MDARSEAARQAFPRGLAQPDSGFRFGADALLLASFAARLPGERVLDCGTGCGPAGLGLLLSRNDAATTVLGLDKEPGMVAAARENADTLGLTERFTAHLLDVRDIRQDADIAAESFDLVLANPPYRHPGSGRRPTDAGRDAARFETHGGLAAFAAAAAYAVKNQGLLACIFLAERLAHIVATCAANRLEIKRLLPIAPRTGKPAGQILIVARKNGRPGLCLESPLVLYEGHGAASRLTAAALAFCPFLACNAGAQADGASI